jgi:hypothetical protein
LAINAKGGELIDPKQKDRTTTPFCFQKLFHKGGEISEITKTLLTAKRRTSSGGSFYLAKGKAFETGGEFFKIFKMLLENMFLYHWLVAKEF